MNKKKEVKKSTIKKVTPIKKVVEKKVETKKLPPKHTSDVKKENKKIVLKSSIKKPIIKKDFKSGNKNKNFFTKKIEDNIEIKETTNNKVKISKKGSSKNTTDQKGRVYATGKRKNAIAKVWIKKGKGNITINNIPVGDYLKRDILVVMVNTPFIATKTEGEFDVICEVTGGGISGQAGAIKHGISKALNLFNETAYRRPLKKGGFLTRDARIVERKKPGLKKARKGQVFNKR